MSEKTIKNRIKESGLTQWRVAEKIGISEFTLVRWLRGTPTKEHTEKIINAIEQLTKERETI